MLDTHHSKMYKVCRDFVAEGQDPMLGVIKTHDLCMATAVAGSMGFRDHHCFYDTSINGLSSQRLDHLWSISISKCSHDSCESLLLSREENLEFTSKLPLHFEKFAWKGDNMESDSPVSVDINSFEVELDDEGGTSAEFSVDESSAESRMSGSDSQEGSSSPQRSVSVDEMSPEMLDAYNQLLDGARADGDVMDSATPHPPFQLERGVTPRVGDICYMNMDLDPNPRKDVFGIAGEKHIQDKFLTTEEMCRNDCREFSCMRQLLRREFGICRLCATQLKYTPERWTILYVGNKSRLVYDDRNHICGSCVRFIADVHHDHVNIPV